MAELANSRVLNLDGNEVIVRELTVAGVRKMITAELSDDILDLHLFEDLRLRDLQLMTSLTVEQIDTLRPSQVEEVVKVCKEMNRHFFTMLTRLNSLREKR